ncbi:TonB-dependent receptor domain-containing protein [Methylobacillus flagellatus]|uniref:TonB-dependent receptor domain-containing protein n=1 Tax=Methylobacillus flagellatus TaxID=405 RepID=UPI00148516AB|nr:TonB-dependent receptor [Methylobacillus flagellatus]
MQNLPLAVAETDSAKTNTKYYNIPASPLGNALSRLAGQSGITLSFDPKLTDGKDSKGLTGTYSLSEGFRKLLEDSGLEVVNDQHGGYFLDKAAPVVKPKDKVPELGADIKTLQLDAVNVRAKRFYEIGPLPGLGLTKEEIPGNVQSISAEEIKAANSISLADLFNRKLQSVNVNDYQGNPFQMDITYRGFTAGPQIGTPQGLSVFFDGIRVNEPFGDVVNWDMIPMNALASVDVFPGSNPIFGLNTLGGAFTVKTKDGFNHEGFDANVLTGSFGRKQLQTEAGWNNGTIGLFGAGNFFLEDGWRENSPSRVNQFFGKASYRGDKLDLNFSTLWVGTDLVGNGLIPSEMYRQDRNSVFTSPDTTENDLKQFQLSGNYFVNDNFSVTGQIYRRMSDRRQKGADAFTGFAGNDEAFARRLPNPGEEYTCTFASNNEYGLPDYYVFTVDADNAFGQLFDLPFVQESFATGLAGDPNSALLPPDALNKPLPAEFLAYFQQEYKVGSNFFQDLVYDRSQQPILLPGDTNEFGEPEYVSTSFTGLDFRDGYANSSVVIPTAFNNFYYSEENGVRKKNWVVLAAPTNNENCSATQSTSDIGTGGRGAYAYIDPQTGAAATIDGAPTGGTGVVAGTPTAVLTDNRINQITDGASFQLNWNLDKHKLMIGASIDAAEATYTNFQQLGMLDANRDAFLAPDLIHPQFAGAFIPLANNNFSGTNTTKSIYFSETWKPVDNWNFTAAARYNETQTKNKVATRYGGAAFELGEFIAYPDRYTICPNGDCTGVPVNYKLPDTTNILDAPETEKFSYYSLNPSLGATWQATPALNIYANAAQGTRTPSVIELGCAFDRTPVPSGGMIDTDGDGVPDTQNTIPKSIQENRSCTLPTTLSGDPYLPQIKATTFDLGMRGTIGDKIRWNLGAYQTELKDDIYFVARQNNSGFFDSIGDTRRRGIEAGIAGESGKLRYSLNYAMTDATFQNDFLMYSADNSSAFIEDGLGNGVIRVKPGAKIPGVPLHNLNANIGYDLTDKWNVGLTAVVHSESFLRGNENNEHEQGVVRTVQSIRYVNGVPEVYTRTLPPTTNPGKVSGYATFNFQSSYRLNKEWTASVLVNNLLDKEYFSAGRLGRNPFSPSVLGAVGPDGYNHNSDDWRSTNFIAPGAPRGIWFSLRYSFKPD